MKSNNIFKNWPQFKWWLKWDSNSHLRRDWRPEVALGWDFSGIPNPISQIPGFLGFLIFKFFSDFLIFFHFWKFFHLWDFFGIFLSHGIFLEFSYPMGFFWDFYPRLFEKIPWDFFPMGLGFFSWDGKSHKKATFAGDSLFFWRSQELIKNTE